MKKLLYSGIAHDKNIENGFVEAENNKEALRKLREKGLDGIRLYDDAVTAIQRNDLGRFGDNEIEKVAEFEIKLRNNPGVITFLKQVLRANSLLIGIGVGVLCWAGYAESYIGFIMGLVFVLSMPIWSLWNYRHVKNYNRLQTTIALGQWNDALVLIDKLRNHMQLPEMAFDLAIWEACIVARKHTLDAGLKVVEEWRDVFEEDSPGLFESRIAVIHHSCGDYDGFLKNIREAHFKSPESSLLTLDLALAEARLGSADKASDLLTEVREEELPPHGIPFINWAKGVIAQKKNNLSAKEYLSKAVAEMLTYRENPVIWTSLALCVGVYAIELYNCNEEQKAGELVDKVWQVLKVHGDEYLLKEINKKLSAVTIEK